MSVCQSGVGDVDPMQVMCAPAAPRPVPLMAGKMAAAVAVCRNSPIPPLSVARGGRKIRPVVFVPLAPAPTVGRYCHANPSRGLTCAPFGVDLFETWAESIENARRCAHGIRRRCRLVQ